MHYCQFGYFYSQHIYVGFPLLLRILTSCGLSLVWCPPFPLPTLAWCIWIKYKLRYMGEIKDFPMYRLRFCIHPCSYSLANFDRLNCPSWEDLKIIPWICCCCKALYCRSAGRTATTVDDNRFISFLSSLTVTSDFSRSSLHWVFIFSNFSCGRLSVIFCESTKFPTNFKVNDRSAIVFECWLKTPSFEAEISTFPEQLVVLSRSCYQEHIF